MRPLWASSLALLCACAAVEPGVKGRLVPVRAESSLLDRAHQGRKFALVIGIDRFDDARWRSLRFAAKDATDVGTVLRDPARGGFDEVTVLASPEQTRRDAIVSAVRALATKATRPDDVVVLYLSSHGTLARDNRGELARYLVTSDTSFDAVPPSAIAMDALKHELEALPARRRLLVLASCHSGGGKSLLTAEVQRELEGIKAGFFARPLEESSRISIVLSASDWGETAREDEALQNDIYTHFLLESLDGQGDRNLDGAVTATEAHDYARRRTFAFTGGRQRPSAEILEVGADPVVLSGQIQSVGAPELFSYAPRLEGFTLKVDGEERAELPGGASLAQGAHTVELTKGGETLVHRRVELQARRAGLARRLARPEARAEAHRRAPGRRRRVPRSAEPGGDLPRELARRRLGRVRGPLPPRGRARRRPRREHRLARALPLPGRERSVRLPGRLGGSVGAAHAPVRRARARHRAAARRLLRPPAVPARHLREGAERVHPRPRVDGRALLRDHRSAPGRRRHRSLPHPARRRRQHPGTGVRVGLRGNGVAVLSAHRIQAVTLALAALLAGCGELDNEPLRFGSVAGRISPASEDAAIAVVESELVEGEVEDSRFELTLPVGGWTLYAVSGAQVARVPITIEGGRRLVLDPLVTSPGASARFTFTTDAARAIEGAEVRVFGTPFRQLRAVDSAATELEAGTFAPGCYEGEATASGMEATAFTFCVEGLATPTVPITLHES